MAAVDPSVAPLEAVWPLFQLRIRSEHLVLRLPTDDDLVPLLAVAKAGIHPPDEMPFGVAWTSAEGPAFDQGFLAHHWDGRARWSVDRSAHRASKRGRSPRIARSIPGRGSVARSRVEASGRRCVPRFLPLPS